MKRKLRRRIYVAGAIRNPDNVEFLNNLRQGIRVCTELILEGYAPFCPFLDFMYFLQLREDERFTVKDIHEYSLSFLPDSELVLVLPTLGKGEGVVTEVEEAVRLNIPVFYDRDSAVSYLKILEESDAN